ncbi:MAG: delta-aminolevulinic acid dehydratase, partial [Halioglobus sp.]
RAIAGLTVALSFAVSAQEECECIWRGSFTDVQGDTELVVAATVLSHKGNSIDLEINRILRGDEPPPPLRVWLKTADYCRPEVSEFPVDSRWVFALYRINESVPGGFNPGTPNLSYGRIDDYQLSSCGGYWLREAGDRVTGNLVGAPRWVREPKMNPVLLDLVAAFVAGEIGPEALLAASQEDPALKELMLDTRSFLRGGD